MSADKNQTRVLRSSGSFLTTEDVDIKRSPSARRLALQDRAKDSPPPSPRLQIKRKGISLVRDNELNTNNKAPKTVVLTENRLNVQDNKNNANDVSRLQPKENLQTGNDGMKRSMSAFPLKDFRISDEILKHNFRPITAEKSDYSLDHNMALSVAVEQTDKSVTDVNSSSNRTFLRKRHSFSSLPETEVQMSKPQDYWMISKLGGVFRRQSLDQDALKVDTMHLELKHQTISEVSETSEKSDIDTALTPVNNKLETLEHSGKKSLMSKLTTWLTTSPEVKQSVHHESGDSNNDVSKLKETGKSIFNWGTKKKVSFKNKHVNMISPTSL